MRLEADWVVGKGREEPGWEVAWAWSGLGWEGSVRRCGQAGVALDGRRAMDGPGQHGGGSSARMGRACEGWESRHGMDGRAATCEGETSRWGLSRSELVRHVGGVR